MGIFSSNARKSELEDLLIWVKKHKQYYHTDDEDNPYQPYGTSHPYISYRSLVAEIERRIKEVDYE